MKGDTRVTLLKHMVTLHHSDLVSDAVRGLAAVTEMTLR